MEKGEDSKYGLINTAYLTIRYARQNFCHNTSPVCTKHLISVENSIFLFNLSSNFCYLCTFSIAYSCNYICRLCIDVFYIY